MASAQASLRRWRHACRFDLCFKSRSDEKLFAESWLAVPAVQSEALVSVEAVYVAAINLRVLLQEVHRTQHPFRWEAADVRSHYFAALIVVEMLLLSFIGCCRASGVLRLASQGRELLWVSGSLPALLAALFAGGPRLFIRGPSSQASFEDQLPGSETTAVLAVQLIFGALCAFAPIRCFRLQFVAVVSAVLGSVAAIAAAPHSGSYSVWLCTANALQGLSLTVLFFLAARMRESAARQLWLVDNTSMFGHADATRLSGKPTSAPGFSSVVPLDVLDEAFGEASAWERERERLHRTMRRSAGCRIVLCLGWDLHITGSGSLERCIFGKEVEGLPLKTLLQAAEEGPFEDFVRDMNGAKVPRWFRAHMWVDGELSKVMLFIHFLGLPDIQFMVGVAEEVQHCHSLTPKSPGAAGQPTVSAEALPNVIGRGTCQDDDCHSCGANSSLGFSSFSGDDVCREMETQTDLAWVGQEGFRCRRCAKPPLPARDAATVAQLKVSKFIAKRLNRLSASGKSPKGDNEMDGNWTIDPSLSHIAQDFMHHLLIQRGQVIDATGRAWRMRYDEAGCAWFLKGRIYAEEGRLRRDGKSGISLYWTRAPPNAQFASVELPDDPLDGEETSTESAYGDCMGSTILDPKLLSLRRDVDSLT